MKKFLNHGWAISDELLERTDLEMSEKVLIAILGRLGALEKPVYPRHQWLAKKMGMSKSGIRKILLRLKNKGFVSYVGRKWKVAMYSLSVPKGHLSVSQKDTDSVSQKDTHKKEIQSKEIQIKSIYHSNASVAEQNAGKRVNEIIALFEPINPTYKRLFCDKTQRAAVERLLRQFGYEKLAAGVKMLPQIVGRRFAPRITTPLQLEKKMGELKIFLQQEQDKKIKII